MTFDLVGDVGDDLHRAAQKRALTLPVEKIPVYPAGGHGAPARQALVHKPLIVAQIKVGLRAVVGNEHLAVLIGAHGAGVHIQIGVEFLVPHPQTPLLQKAAQRRRADALTQSGHHAACHKYIFHTPFPVPFRAPLFPVESRRSQKYATL